jgi:hypothetical protein
MADFRPNMSDITMHINNSSTIVKDKDYQGIFYFILFYFYHSFIYFSMLKIASRILLMLSTHSTMKT